MSMDNQMIFFHNWRLNIKRLSTLNMCAVGVIVTSYVERVLNYLHQIVLFTADVRMPI